MLKYNNQMLDYKAQNQLKHSGFTLVELAIVLVIIGLVVGGVLSGYQLVKTAELRVILSENETYKTAVYAFRTKYSALPGDMRNATKFFGSAASCPPAPLDTPIETGTCNGNGDRRIADHLGSDQYEKGLFWHHLAAAEMVAGSFTGVPGNTQYHAIPGEDVPESKYSGGAWTARYRNVPPGDPNYFAINMNNAFIFGAGTTTITHGKLLTPSDAWYVDSKYDDGRPGRGRVISRYWNNQCSDASSNQDYDASYRLEDTSPQCAMAFLKAI